MKYKINKFVYLGDEERPGVNHIQEVPEPTEKRVLEEEKKSIVKNIIYVHF